jgi:hypothetical protein
VNVDDEGEAGQRGAAGEGESEVFSMERLLGGFDGMSGGFEICLPLYSGQPVNWT